MKLSRQLCMKYLYWAFTGQLIKRLRCQKVVQQLQASNLFDADFYIRENPDVVATGIEPLTHYVWNGVCEGRDPHRFFSTRYYLEMNPDVRAAGINPLLHFYLQGAAEQRSPCSVFDFKYYLRMNSEVESSELNPAIHFVLHGGAAGLASHPLFDSQYYLKTYEDAAKSEMPPLIHFLEIGASKFYKPHPLFDTHFYCLQNPDVVQQELNPLCHYLTHGEREGRNPNPYFDVKYYSKTHFHGADFSRGVLLHFIEEGWKRGLKPSREVNFAVYLRHHAPEFEAEVIYSDFFENVLPRSPGSYLSVERIVAASKIPADDKSVTDNQKFGLEFYAPLTVVSGLGQAARGYLRGIRSANVACSTQPISGPAYQREQRLEELENQEKFPLALAFVNAPAVEGFLKSEAGARFLSARYRIGAWVWELPAFPQEWQTAISPFDEIWVPSEFCRRAVQAVTSTPVYCIPYVVEPALESLSCRLADKQKIRQKIDIAAESFLFLYVFDASSYLERKNPLALISAFLNEFSSRENAVLLLKVSYSSQANDFEKQLENLVPMENRLQVRFITEVYEHSELYQLIDCCDCYVSPHRSEGFGLTLAEALIFSKPVIATDYGGSVDFITSKTAYPVANHLIEIEKDIGPYLSGNVWAEPDIVDLQQQMRHVFEHREEARERAIFGQQSARESFSAGKVGSLINARMIEIAKKLKLERLRSLSRVETQKSENM